MRAEISSGRKCTVPSRNSWHPPVCLNYKSESGCKYGDKCQFRHDEAHGQPSKTSKKRSVALLEDSIQFVCVSQDSHPRKSFLRKRENIGIKSHHQVFQGHAGTTSKFGKVRVHREELSKSVKLMSAIRALLDLRKGHKTKPCTKKDAPADCLQAHKYGINYVLLSY